MPASFSLRSLVIAALLAVWACSAPARADGGAPSPTDGSLNVGDMAPAFSLAGMDGRQVAVGGQRSDRPVLLVFWSYFCLPCQRELPRIQALYEELGPERLTVLGVCLDGPAFDDKVLPFLARNGITFPNAYDRETEVFFEVAARYGVVGTPTLFLLEPAGRVRFIHLGRLETDVLRGLVEAARHPAYCAEITKPSPPVSR